jgi:hypothetical protein
VSATVKIADGLPVSAAVGRGVVVVVGWCEKGEERIAFSRVNPISFVETLFTIERIEENRSEMAFVALR